MAKRLKFDHLTDYPERNIDGNAAKIKKTTGTTSNSCG